MHRSTKHYGHDVGLSAVFRQWRATSHCNQLHGYALAVTLVFGADELDSRNWVVDFGALKPVKEWLQSMFDHKLLVAKDDPQLSGLMDLDGIGLASVNVVGDVGCEAFAEMIYGHVHLWMATRYLAPMLHAYGATQRLGVGNPAVEIIKPPKGLHLISVEVREHGANSALYQPDTAYRYNV